ncbi:hypothetical protein BG011_002929 [Mortierella polycephala]|uniref:Uncharacterized protein n=1 Tax=Mortierella polycephala TaxID=41804 RepID=A0A9P6QHR6_9FUNG|nr:hypothetical protein BG011_002929 [Mortierella polycephala]
MKPPPHCACSRSWNTYTLFSINALLCKPLPWSTSNDIPSVSGSLFEDISFEDRLRLIGKHHDVELVQEELAAQQRGSWFHLYWAEIYNTTWNPIKGKDSLAALMNHVRPGLRVIYNQLMWTWVGWDPDVPAMDLL